MMWSTLVAFHRSFHSSWVIWFGRSQVLLGAVWFVLTTVDLAPLIGNPKYVTAWLVFSGVITETFRRQGTYQNDDGQLVPRPRNDSITVNVNNEPAPPVAASPVPTSGTSK